VCVLREAVLAKGRNEILVALGHRVLREGGGREGECVV